MLGSQLVELGLITYEALEDANEKFLDTLHDSESGVASLLRILLVETKALAERDLIEEQIENHGLSVCTLDRIDFDPEEWDDIDVSACYATRTIPMDRVDDIMFVASCCYLSRPVREYWEKQFGASLVWVIAPFFQIEERLKTFEEARIKAEAEAQA